MKKPFCLYLTNNRRFEYDSYAPCCWITKKINIHTCSDDELIEYENWMNQIDDWVPECNFCQEKESRGVESFRQRVELKPTGIKNDNDIGKITTLEFQIDSDCNAACLICGPHNSTTWQKYNLGQIENKNKSNKKIDLISDYQTTLRYEKAKSFISFKDINLVSFLGGEPLINDFHKKVLLDIQKHKPLQETTVRYVTNGSKQPDPDTIELWKQVEHLEILFSLDGTGEHFNYWRWPLQWSQVENNIKYLIDLNLPSVNFRISSAINPFTIFYYDRYMAWEKEIFINYPINDIRFAKAFDATGVVNTHCIPLKLQEVVKQKYADYPWLVNRMRPFVENAYSAFMNHIELHDKKRNTNWRETFPEIVQYFK